MRILLLNPPYSQNFIRSARSTWPSISGSNWYPIFLAYAAGWLIKHGHEVKLLDALVEELSGKEVVKITENFKPKILALYISEESFKKDIRIGVDIKKRIGCEIVLVGPWCSYEPEKLLKENLLIDMVVRREFDDVLLDLANGKSKKLIKGLIYREEKKIYANPEREFLTSKQLEEMPFVTEIYKKFLPIKKYYQASLLHPFVDLFTGWGCIWGKCSFCLWPNTIHKGAPSYRTRSVDSVMSELWYIKRELLEVKEVFFQDDTFATFRAREISERILKEGLSLVWSCYVRANVDLDTLKLMKQAGCRYLHVGYESIDEGILKNINKGTNPTIMTKFTQDAKNAGIRVHGDFIIGLPGETEETIAKSIQWAKDLKIEGYQFFIPQPHKGTPLYTYLKSKKFMDKKGRINYPHLTFETMNSMRFGAMREIYSSPIYMINTLKHVESFEDLFRLTRTALHVIPNIIKAKKV